MSTRLDRKISIIIPVYNEAKVIGGLLDNLELFRDRAEIIFVDGSSTDNSPEIISRRYDLYYSPRKGRASQMNYGASLAKGEVFLFLHADSILEENALLEINRTMDMGHKVGCFKIRFRSRSFLMKICGLMSNLRVIFRNIAFGDQGIFIDRDYFYQLGGFKEMPLMEDYQLSIDIKKDGKKIRSSNSIIESSERRFVENGRLRTMARMQRLQYMYRRGRSVEEIANLYK